jgi:hypothetical protein
VSRPLDGGRLGVVVNTDAALIDPDWDVFAAEHERRYGLAISHLKSLVRGQSYDNEVMKVRVGTGGFYVQSRRFPAAFYGDTNRPVVREIGLDEAEVVAWDAAAHYRAGEARSLTCIYGDDDPPDVFFGYRLAGRRRYELGALRHRLPMHARVLVEGAPSSELTPGGSGVVVLQRLPDGRHVLLTALGRRPPFAGSFEPEG